MLAGVNQAGLPRTTRYPLQSSDGELTQFNCSGSDSVLRVFGVDGDGFPGLKIPFVSHKELRAERGGTDLDKLLQLFRDLRHQLRAGDAPRCLPVIHDPDLESSPVTPVGLRDTKLTCAPHPS